MAPAPWLTGAGDESRVEELGRRATHSGPRTRYGWLVASSPPRS
ncbi:hypothetical protein E2C01_065676 [Portunus trituberculatus]|uniref:Uncharacterized protein n=1 Tax=Portunus trituberculatus TaxID=210409 RepID=A0A5B7HNX2_PORTR|nr:hypothetical protein [Portunus trituberculatus]